MNPILCIPSCLLPAHSLYYILQVNTQVQIKLFIESAGGWIPYEVRQRLRQQQQNRINKEGYLVLQVQEHRTQTQNRKTAIAKLQEMILQAWVRPKVR
jgi:ribosome-associated protein